MSMNEIGVTARSTRFPSSDNTKYPNASEFHSVQDRYIIKNPNSVIFSKYLWTCVRLNAGLGNQMFQFSSASGIAKRRGSNLCIIGGYSHFRLAIAVDFLYGIQSCDFEHWMEMITESGFATYDERLEKQDGNISVGDFLQSFKYFDEVPFRLKTAAWGYSGVCVGWMEKA